MLKANSKGMIATEMTKILRVMCPRIGYLVILFFHKLRYQILPYVCISLSSIIDPTPTKSMNEYGYWGPPLSSQVTKFYNFSYLEFKGMLCRRCKCQNITTSYHERLNKQYINGFLSLWCIKIRLSLSYVRVNSYVLPYNLN